MRSIELLLAITGTLVVIALYANGILMAMANDKSDGRIFEFKFFDMMQKVILIILIAYMIYIQDSQSSYSKENIKNHWITKQKEHRYQVLLNSKGDELKQYEVIESKIFYNNFYAKDLLEKLIGSRFSPQIADNHLIFLALSAGRET